MKSTVFAILFVILAVFCFFTGCGDSTDPGVGPQNPINPGGPTYTVTFNINGGSGTAPSAQTVPAGSRITLPMQSSSGATFIGWNTNADGSGTNYSAGSSYTVTGAVILYANWDVSTYTITFNANSATSGTGYSRQVPAGYSTTLPESTLIYADFTGWNTKADGSGTAYAADSSYTPAGNSPTIVLYAQWGNIVPLSSVTGFENKLNWLRVHAQSDTGYTVEVDNDESISPRAFSYSDRSGIVITLTGSGGNRTVSLSSNGAMFTVNFGVTLVLDNDITLQGHSYNNSSLVRVDGGALIMNNGSAITGNTSSYSDSSSNSNPSNSPSNSGSNSYGGGVYVGSGTFTMSGGEISGNTSKSSSNISSPSFASYARSYSYGGGVYVGSGTFTMSGGEISGNTSNPSSSGSGSGSSYSYSCGGGVYVESGTFTMSGGEISGNTSNPSSSGSYSGSYSYGGGVYVESGTFTMSGGEISGHTGTSGGGVYVESGTLTMEGGEISGNTGHGVYGDGTFTMSGGEISGNTGHGVYGGGTFTMSGGEISGNSGRGVYVGGIFDKTGGTIYGYSASDTINSNSDGAVYRPSASGVLALRRNTTAGPAVNLYCNGSTFSGGWEF